MPSGRGLLLPARLTRPRRRTRRLDLPGQDPATSFPPGPTGHRAPSPHAVVSVAAVDGSARHAVAAVARRRRAAGPLAAVPTCPALCPPPGHIRRQHWGHGYGTGDRRGGPDVHGAQECSVVSELPLVPAGAVGCRVRHAARRGGRGPVDGLVGGLFPSRGATAKPPTRLARSRAPRAVLLSAAGLRPGRGVPLTVPAPPTCPRRHRPSAT